MIKKFDVDQEYIFRTKLYLEQRMKEGWSAGAIVTDLKAWAVYADEAPVKILHSGAIGEVMVNDKARYVDVEECQIVKWLEGQS